MIIERKWFANVYPLRPEGPLDDSPGQRPGGRRPNKIPRVPQFPRVPLRLRHRSTLGYHPAALQAAPGKTPFLPQGRHPSCRGEDTRPAPGKTPFLPRGRHPSCTGEDTLPAPGKTPFLHRGRHPSCLGEDTPPASGKTPFPHRGMCSPAKVPHPPAADLIGKTW